MPRLRSFVLPLLLSLGAVVAAQDPAAESRPGSDLRIRLENGRVVRALLSSSVDRMNLVPKMGLQQQSADWLQEIEFSSSRPSTRDRTYVTAKFLNARIRFMHPLFGGAVFDSRAPLPPDNYHPVMLIAAGYYLGYVGQTFTFELDAEGRILGIEGLDAAAKAVASLAQANAQTKQMAAMFEANARLYFDQGQVKAFLQPLFAQTPTDFAAVGRQWPGKALHSIFAGSRNASPIEWSSVYKLAAREKEFAVLELGGEHRVFEPYSFSRGPKSAGGPPREVGAKEADAAISRPTPGSRPSRSRTGDARGDAAVSTRGRRAEKTAKGRGEIDLADGLYRTLELELTWLDDKPEYKEEEGPGPNDERRHDVVKYRLVRVAEFASTWPADPAAPK
jgi:hypothetical protein